MIIWSIQQKQILDSIQNGHVYYPDINKSPFVAENPQLRQLYQLVLTAFNHHNQTNATGVIFGFMVVKDNHVQEIQTYDEFIEFLNKNRPVMDSLLKKFNRTDYEIVQLVYPEHMNPIKIDINDFQYLMPPRMVLPPFDATDFYTIEQNILNNQVKLSKLPSNVIQVHAPFILKDNIVARYSL